MFEDLVALLCLCGHAVSVLLQDEGEKLCILAFFYNELTSETYGKRVRECPCCGEQLELHRLIARS
jgi:hypothetical protein